REVRAEIVPSERTIVPSRSVATSRTTPDRPTAVTGGRRHRAATRPPWPDPRRGRADRRVPALGRRAVAEGRSRRIRVDGNAGEFRERAAPSDVCPLWSDRVKPGG